MAATPSCTLVVKARSVWSLVAVMLIEPALSTVAPSAMKAWDVLLSLITDTEAPRPTKPPPKATEYCCTSSTSSPLTRIWPPA